MDKKRYHLIDSLRGFAVINMVIYHLCFDIFVIFLHNSRWQFDTPILLWERFIAISFVLISGLSLNLSAHPIKRGLIVNLFGLIVTAVTLVFMPSQVIWFGVLNFLGCAMMLGGAVKRLLNKINCCIGFTVSVLLYAFLYNLPNRSVGFFSHELFKIPDSFYFSDWFTVFGFPPDSFFSSDYFPIFPWIFVFFAGFFLWKIIQNHNSESFFTAKIPFLSLCGRYTLWIYLAHQPICYGIVYLIFKL